MLGRRDPRALEAYDPGSVEHARIAAAMARPSLFDSFVRYLDNQGYAAAAAALDRDVTQPLEPCVRSSAHCWRRTPTTASPPRCASG